MDIFLWCFALIVVTHSQPLNSTNDSHQSDQSHPLNSTIEEEITDLDDEESTTISDLEEEHIVPPPTGFELKGKAPTFFHCTSQSEWGVPGDCNKYFICQRAGLKSIFGYCTGHKRFHHQKRLCLSISEDMCHASMCKKPTDRFPDPYEKENYLSCFRMFPEVTPCPDGNIYNKKAKLCVPGSPLAGLKTSAEMDLPVIAITVVPKKVKAFKGKLRKIKHKTTKKMKHKSTTTAHHKGSKKSKEKSESKHKGKSESKDKEKSESKEKDHHKKAGSKKLSPASLINMELQEIMA